MFAHVPAIARRFDPAVAAAFGCIIALLLIGSLYSTSFLSPEYLLQQLQVASFLGLVATGALLHPQLTTPLIMVKMVSVIGVSVVGILALATKRAMMRSVPRVPQRLLLRGLVLTAASQAFWWTAVLVGFLTASPEV